MITFKLVQYGKSPQAVTADVKKKTEDIVANLISIAEQTRDLMRTTITSSAKSVGGVLESRIEVETIPLVGGGIDIGIGNIELLMKEAPYWWVLNYGTLYGTGIQYVPGRKATDPTQPKFIPGYWQGNRFVYAPFSGGGMVPKNPITPINYIEMAVNYMDLQLRRI
jgi:hypothetical protein